MNYGVTLTGVGPMADPDKLRRLACKADQLGFHSLWLYEHVAFPAKIPESYGKISFTPETPFLDPVATLAYLAADTKQIRLGIGVLLVVLRHPLMASKLVSTLDVISGGRVILGVGLGWLAEEYEAQGIPFKERAGRLQESVEILRKIWVTGKLQYQGRYYQFPESTSYPLPLQRGGPPIWFGATVESALKRAAELGDGWLGIPGPPETIEKQLSQVIEFARQARKKDFIVAMGATPEITAEEVAHLRQMGVNHINLTFTAGEAAEIEARMESAVRRLAV